MDLNPVYAKERVKDGGGQIQYMHKTGLNLVRNGNAKDIGIYNGEQNTICVHKFKKVVNGIRSMQRQV